MRIITQEEIASKSNSRKGGIISYRLDIPLRDFCILNGHTATTHRMMLDIYEQEYLKYKGFKIVYAFLATCPIYARYPDLPFSQFYEYSADKNWKTKYI